MGIEIEGVVPFSTKGIFTTARFSPAGIVTGAAYADLDAIGTLPVEVAVPQSGTIMSAIYYDLDDEGLQVDLWLFSSRPGVRTENAQFDLSDGELITVIDVIQFVGFRDAASGQVSIQNGLNIAYNLGPSSSIYIQLQARGALNIAAGSLPAFRLSILPD